MDDVIVATFSPVGDVAVVEVTISTLLATEVTVELLDDSDAVIQSQTVRVVYVLGARPVRTCTRSDACLVHIFSNSMARHA